MKTKTKATTKTTKLSKIELKIKMLNAAYSKASPAQRRKMIAKDCLEQIAKERFVSTEGVWATVLQDGVEVSPDDPLQPILHEPTVACECCGVGALFLSYVRLNNKAVYNDTSYYSTMEHIIHWPKDNLRLIEIAFEEGSGQHSVYNKEDLGAERFGNKYRDSTNRLNAILNNIIASKDSLFHP